MPLSAVCVSVASNRPTRTWSTSNIPSKDARKIFNMNSAEDITTYREPPFHSPNFQRRTLGCSYDFPEKTYKKDKKWSITSIFRRKKKDETESSSEDDAQKKNFLGRRKKKSESKRKKPTKSAPFDHVVMPPGSRNSLSYSGNNYHEESAIMSDPTAGISNYSYANRSLPQIPPQKMSESFSGSVDSVRKSKRGQTKARAEARRNSSKNGSSSEEESHHSNSSILVNSEENLKILEKQMSKRSRAARTERYLKRHSRDGENPHNYLRVYKSDATDDSNRSPSRSPLIPRTVTPTEIKHKLSHSSLNSQSSNLSGLSTIPPSHTAQTRYRISNSTSNPNYKPPQSMNDYNNSMKKYPNNLTTDQRSYSCDDNIHKSDAVHVQFPVMRLKRGYRNLSLIDASQLPSMRHPPPPPPPRDPNRTVFDRPNTFYFDNTGQANAKMFSYTNPYQEQLNKKRVTSNLHPSYRSTSEDHLARNNTLKLPLDIRPSSTTPESQRLVMKNDDIKVKPVVKEEYNYLTDKKPRSRKPIFIKPGIINNSNAKENEGTNKALNFWKQIDRQTTMNQSKTRSPSPQMFSSHTQVQTKIFLPNVTPTEADTDKINPITVTNPVIIPLPIDAVTKEDIKRKSCNLEEALNELEAIYNSLKLGDEDLLERAEQKEKEMLTKKFESMNAYPSNASKGALSDSSFSYEPFDTVDSPRRKRLSKKTHNLKLDDMAFRKINKDRANTIGDPQSVVSQVSYLMRSPVFSRNHTFQLQRNNQNNSEPDITLDDVVYRNVKHSNSGLKVVEPQPPFGIPLGPITPGANSDYLHAKPELIYKPSFKHKKIPDIVKDDLAFRNLRKDCNKGPSLPPLSNEDFSNNNSEANLRYLKKKRAQRSMSANIGNILNEGVGVDNHFKTLTDIADAMEIARKVLREKDNKISATKKAFMSDTDATYPYGFDSTKESRLNFLNELRGSVPGKSTTFPKKSATSPALKLSESLSLKPPRGLTPERTRRSPKESTPIPVSPFEDKRSNNSESTPSSLDDLLNALAVEAKETTDRITLELQKLSEDKEKDKEILSDTVSKRLSEIDEVSQKAKLCDKLLDSKDFITVLKNPDDGEEEEVRSIHEAPVEPESATIIMSRFKAKDEESNKSNESEHDYENLTSDIEVTLDLSEVEQREVRCLSPFEEKKAELIASFQVLKNNTANDPPVKIVSLYDNVDSLKDGGGAVTDKHSVRRPRLSSCPRFFLHGNLQDHHVEMAENQESRLERIARYKEERRKQLNEQFSSYKSPSKSPRPQPTANANSSNSSANSSNSSESPRPTIASRLRAAAALSQKLSTNNDVNESEPKAVGSSKRIERDKSNKRKSNLNRSLNSEEVPLTELNSDVKDRRRRRRFFPAELFESSSVSNSSAYDTNNTTTTTASLTSPTVSPNTAVVIATTPSKPTHKKSELSEHMENARRNVTSPFSEMGKYKPYAKRVVTSSPNPKPKSSTTSPRASTTRLNERVQSIDSLHRVPSSPKSLRMIASDDEKTKAIAGRMEGLSALTKQTLARVERLTNRSRESPKKELEQKRNHRKPEQEKSLLFSILKKNSMDEIPSIVVDNPVLSCASTTIGPVSILKRKVSQDSNNSTNNTTPVTFSPSVLEPTTSRRKQGILKKRRSLDESTVMRHRSCSPDVANKPDSRSILKNQRRSSLEELRRTQSPETQLHSILKRRSSKYDDDDHSLNSPQSILKRRSGASSASSTGSSPHVSITTAVILAAAGGAEMVLGSDGESVRPILKKSSFSFSEEYVYHGETYGGEGPKPILKKKSSTDTDESEEKPRPILKFPRSSVEMEIVESNADSKNSSETECEVRPILKQGGSREEPPRRLSFRASFGENQTDSREEMRQRIPRRSHTICSDFEIDSLKMRTAKEPEREGGSDAAKPRPFSVLELVMSFEQSSSTGAVPKRSHYKRTSNRYKTQPVTINELEASRNLVKSPQRFNDDRSASSFSKNCDSHSLLDFTSSLERDDEGNVKSFFSSSMHNNQDSPESTACEKMSSDSAFQSLGDGLELEQVDEPVQESEHEQIISEHKQEFFENHLQIANALENANSGDISKELARSRYRSRRHGSSSQFLTQPVTFEEIRAATRFSSAGDETTDEYDDRKQKPVAEVNRTSPDKDDEGISCNDSGSSSDSDSFRNVNVKVRTARIAEKKDERSAKEIRTKFGGDSTSDGESSGGREIKSIFKRDSIMKMRQSLEGVISKSKSQESLGNESKSRLGSNRNDVQNNMPQAIADLRAKLQVQGESEWRKRVARHNNASDEIKMLKEKNRNNDEISEKSLLSAKKVELDAASKHWKSRVEKSDAVKFSVAGKMNNNKVKDTVPVINLPAINSADKKIPQQKTFKLKEGSGSVSTSPEKNSCDLIRSSSLSFSTRFNFNSSDSDGSSKITKKSVAVLNPDDVTIRKFFKSYEEIDNKDRTDFSLDDFDSVPRQSLLVIKKNVRVQKRRGAASSNPIKALASRTDISNEYTEILTGVAEREKKRLNIEKLAKNSDKALEAIAGLTSNVDFKAVALKKSSSNPVGQVPWKDVMLLQVKGRRHVQIRLVEPTANSINEGDNYILVTSKALYIYSGALSNVIEQSRTSDIVNHIKKTGDLGCKGSNIFNVSAKDKESEHAVEFWKTLGAETVPDTVDAGHPDEDETYESNILLTNMIYTLDKDELVPCDRYWASIPKVEMLKDTAIYVFDFGSEMYVWSGKNAPAGKKKIALKVAKEMWEDGYDYADCNVCPLNVAAVLGARTREKEKLPLQGSARPKWTLFAKLTQHRETILFKEKFLDWPDFSRIIRMRSNENLSRNSVSFDVQPCDVEEMLKEKDREPDLIVENVHMGRGDQYFDDETRRLFVYETLDVTGWKILEHSYEKLSEKSLGQFYDGDSYIFRWDFRQTVRGRELNGNPSKHAAVGRDRCIFFYWQGSNSSIKEKGVAALLTVELDKENAPQIRIAQGSEPAAFLQLFNGNMVVNKGKRDSNGSKTRLFILRGEKENEMYLMEVHLAMSSLRSRSSFVLFDTGSKQVIIWHGIKSKPVKRKGIKIAVDNFIKNKPHNLYLEYYKDLNIVEVVEGSETEDFLNILGNDRDSYHSLLDSKEPFDHTIRLFSMCSLTGEFLATEILCPHRSSHCSPYPFVQNDLYLASQPALFLIDNNYELWLWQGFPPETNTDDDPSLDQTGSLAVRWQAERKAAMQTAVEFWRRKHGDKRTTAYLVNAGLEPVAFKNLFPAWEDHLDIMELNKKIEKDGEMLPLEKELALLSRTTYPLSDLVNRPLPEGVDPTNIEKYLSADDFQQLLMMTKEDFDKLPSWKKTVLKKEKGLF